jgi:ferrous iron transport protein A
VNGLDALEVTLSACQAGETGEIVEVAAESGLALRLRELGLVPGAALRVARSGSPMIVHVKETRLCLRGEDAEAILVRVELGDMAAPESAPLYSEA